ncbi:hypothetical protein KQX54_019503 [Cotesia glomerata]|uniref:Uncharacterized protein n=1 Tax=Cotesia glomerata TaxID=32391 RepID=A0AAV7I9X2_COTGL|nr:hypothetical protein KQX54_019503 [Cotesia glomerata]
MEDGAGKLKRRVLEPPTITSEQHTGGRWTASRVSISPSSSRLSLPHINPRCPTSFPCVTPRLDFDPVPIRMCLNVNPPGSV